VQRFAPAFAVAPLRIELSFRKETTQRSACILTMHSRTLQDLPKMLLAVKPLTRKLYKFKQNKLDEGQEHFLCFFNPKNKIKEKKQNENLKKQNCSHYDCYILCAFDDCFSSNDA
jgi:hypothetical protein